MPPNFPRRLKYPGFQIVSKWAYRVPPACHDDLGAEDASSSRLLLCGTIFHHSDIR